MSNQAVPTPPQWTSLALLRGQFDVNLAALRARDADLAAHIEAAAPQEPYFLLAAEDRVTLGKQVGTTLQGIANPVPPLVAQQICQKLFPAGPCSEAVTVAGIDQGWIWDALYRLDVKTAAPFHRPPLYFLAHNLTTLWTTLHFQDWAQLLGDERVSIFAGPNAAAQYRDALLNDPRRPLARLSLTVEPAIWQNGDPALASADLIYNAVLTGWDAKLRTIHASLQNVYPPTAADAITRRIAAGDKLRVLGITSRYTTFLQHSMRDWLAAMSAMGHETSLVIEGADFQSMNNVVYLRQVAEFKPDLILMIDHYRGEFRGLPAAVPCVMWVQDYLPTILDIKAGAAQGERDFCLGFGRHYLAREYGYPADRYLPTPVGINDERFASVVLSDDDQKRYACDVSYVSHASATAESLLAEHADQSSPAVRTFLHDVFEELRAHYTAGGGVVGRPATMRMMDAALARRGLAMPKVDFDRACALFTHTLGNALFRHQSLHWLADLGVDLHLYGKGWENHPRFRRFAKGIADNATQLAHIYRASKVNLQVIPHGVVHPRLLDGLSAGAFFLLRYSDGDAVGKQHLELFQYCQHHRIETEPQLAQAAAADPALAALLRQIDVYEGYAEHPREYGVLQVNRTHADSDFFVAAGSIWPEYDDVAYDSKDRLRQRLEYFLARPDERQKIVAAMRGPVIDRCSYKAISRRLLAMIGDRLTAQARTAFQPLRLSA